MTPIEIMLPYYGPVALMQDTVRSVLAQEDPGWTLTVVDDGYPDPTVAEWFATFEDDRVTYLRNDTNLGANRNYQKCVDLLSGEHCVMLGADDLLMPNFVESARSALSACPEATIVQPGVEVIDENGAARFSLVDSAKQQLYAPRDRGPRLFSGEEIAVSLLRGNWLYFPSLVWKSKAMKQHGFQPGLDVVQDLALVMDIIRDGGNLLVNPVPSFEYRRHRQSDSSWRALDGSRFTEERRFFCAEADRLEAIGWRRAARESRRHLSSRLHALTLVPAALRQGNRAGARNLARHAFQVLD